MLSPRSPLGAIPPLASLVVEERPAAIVGLAARRGGLTGLQAKLRASHGIDLPMTPHRVVADGTAFVWSGPERWLVVTDPQDGLEQAWRAAVGDTASVVELGDGRCVLRISGAGVRTAMARLMPIDLHPRVFGPGSVALTVAAHISVQFWQLDDAPTYEIVIARSFAESFLHHLSS
jgi:sarcosine oxidase subunit gamma